MYQERQERVDVAAIVREIKRQSSTLSYAAIARNLFQGYIDKFHGMESDPTLCRVARGLQRLEFGASQYYGCEEGQRRIIDGINRLSDQVSSWEVVADNILALLEVDEEVTSSAMIQFEGERERDTVVFLAKCIRFAVKRPFYKRDRETGQSTYYTDAARLKRERHLLTYDKK